MRILVVDDDDSLRRWVRQALEREGFSVDEASDGRKAKRLASENVYDVILLDVVMPEVNGYTVLRELRTQGVTAAIFMVTGQGGEQDKLEAFDAKANDYIVKPFKLSELIARIRVWVRTRNQFLTSEVTSTVLVVGDLRLDLLRHCAIRDGKVIPLTRKQFQLLEHLMRHPGRVLSQSTIAQNVWNVEYDGASNIVEAQIKNLRALVDEGFSKKLITTVRGSGYMIDDPDPSGK